METLTTMQTRPPETSMFVSAVALGTERRSVSRARHHATAVLPAWEMQGLSHSAELVVRSAACRGALQGEARAPGTVARPRGAQGAVRGSEAR